MKHLAVHFENLLFLLFIAIAFLFQLLTRAASKSSKGPDERSRGPAPQPPRVPRGRPETDEEQIRKFLEALGQPPTSKPPAPVAPRPTYQKPIVLQHMPPLRSPLPPLTTRPPESEAGWQLPREIRLPEQIPPPREKKVFRPRVTEAPAFEVHEGPTQPEPAPVIKTPAEVYAIATQPTQRTTKMETNLAALLRSTSNLRNAIVLREIFGAPRSLQPLDLI